MATKKTDYGKVDSEEDSSGQDENQGGCIQCLVNCPGKCAHFSYHKNDDGQSLFCLLSPTLWCQMTTFLVCLWVISGLFWLLMFYFTVTWPTRSLYAFLISCVLFTALFGVLMATNEEERDDELNTMCCSVEEFKAHIGPQLKGTGFKWENFGDAWHVVHKSPIYEETVSSSPEERLKEVCMLLHYTNTVPVATANLPTRRGSIKPGKSQGKEPASAYSGVEEKQETTDVTIHQ